MNGPAIELSLTESFAKHKRNLLLVCSIVAILAVASPASVKLPGLGTEETVPGPVAYFLLGCTLLYFFVSYCVELLAVRARNLEVTASTSAEGVSGRLMASIRSLGSQIDQIVSSIQHTEETIKRVSMQFNINGAEAVVQDFSNKVGHINDFMDHLIKRDDPGGLTNIGTLQTHVHKLDEKVGSLVKEVETAVMGMRDGVGSLSDAQIQILERTNYLINSSEELSKKFDTISNRISRSQRFGFTTVEQAIPIGLAIAAFIICVDGAFLQSTLAKGIRSNVPAIVEAQRLDAQTGTPINQKP